MESESREPEAEVDDDDDVDEGEESGVDVGSVTHDGRDETKKPLGAVLGTNDQRQDGQRREAADQRSDPRHDEEQYDLASAQHVQVLQRSTDGEVLDHREPPTTAERHPGPEKHTCSR